MSIIARPHGHHVVTPSAVVANPGDVITFLEKAFDGKTVDRYDLPDGSVMHAEVLLGDSTLLIGPPRDGAKPMPAALSFYVDDAEQVDRTFKRALKAGATAVSEPQTMPWGYHAACVSDAAGNRWTICAIVEEVSHDEIVRRMQEMPHN